MNDIGEKIKELRKSRGVSQEQLAFDLNVSRQTITKWEANAVQPNMESITALCKYFGVKYEYFFGEIQAEEEAAAADGVVRAKGKNKPFIVRLSLLIAFSVLFVVFMILTIGSALTVFTVNTGIDYTLTVQLNTTVFICFLVLAVCSLIAASISFIFVIKLKCK
ncbi:MAG: helix-turn-helix domain-containing protein [Clostridia bacterium]|nr:helix-turn-helix domain-containing protein [Clostridia bacterium]